MRLLILCLLTALAGCAQHPANDPLGTPMQSPEARALDSLRRGDYRETLRLNGEILKENPKKRVAQIGVGEAWLGLGEPRPALAAFEAVLKDDPNDTQALEGCGLARLGLRDYARAEQDLLRVLVAQPQSWRALNGLGLVADMRGRYEEAQAWYEKALNANEDEATIYNNYGYSQLMAGQYYRAELLLNQAVAHAPGNGRLRNNLIQAVAWQGDYERALGLRGDIPLHVALNNVGYIAVLRNDRTTAIRLFQEAIDASPNWYRTAAANLERLRQAALVEAAAANAPEPATDASLSRR